MIDALIIVVVFATFMFLALAQNAHLQMRRARNGYHRDLAWRRRDRALTVAEFLASVALALVLIGVLT